MELFTTRQCAFASLLIWALLAGTATGQTKAPKKPGPKPAPANKPPAVAPLRYVMTQEPAYAGTVEEIAEHVVRSKPVPEGTLGPSARGSMTEGLYLAVSFPDLMAPLQNAVVCRVRVTDVGEGGSLAVELAEEAGERIKPGSGLFLFRPVGSTTLLMQAAPGLAPLTIGAPGGNGEGAGAGQEAAMRTLSTNNLKQIGLAMHNFHDAFRKFPPAVVYGPDKKPWHSWRVLILPFLDQQPLFNQYKFDEPWDGPNNKKLIGKMPEVYSDPIHGENKDFFTHYAALTGDGMAFPVKGCEFDETKDDMFKSLTMGSGANGLQDFVDGTANTLLVGTIGPDQKIPWSKPEDIFITAKLPGLGQKGGFAARYASGERKAGLFLFGDGHVQSIRDDVTAESFVKLATIGGREVIGPEDLPGAEPAAPAGRQIPVIEVRLGDEGPTAHLIMETVADQDMLPEPAAPDVPAARPRTTAPSQR